MEEENISYELWAGFAIFFLTTGAFSNLFLLVSVIYAKRQKRHNFDNSEWVSSTVFFLNLALVDLVYCILRMGNAFYGFLIYFGYGNFNDIDGDGIDDYNDGICQFLMLGHWNFSIIDGWSTACIAFITAFPKIR